MEIVEYLDARIAQALFVAQAGLAELQQFGLFVRTLLVADRDREFGEREMIDRVEPLPADRSQRNHFVDREEGEHLDEPFDRQFWLLGSIHVSRKTSEDRLESQDSLDARSQKEPERTITNRSAR